jgi:hypothetical protein
MKYSLLVVLFFEIFLLGLDGVVKAQSSTIINPRYNQSEPPSSYPLGLYLMGSESESPYGWTYDAGVILGLKPVNSNFRHVQMIINSHASGIKMRAKNGTTDQWLGWNKLATVDWVNNNYVKISDGKVGIGTSDPTSILAVKGDIKAQEITVTDQSGDWPDYVFEGKGYSNMDLKELEDYINAHKHLPGIPTQKEIEQKGQNLGDIQARLLEKVEELTLQMIQQNKENQQQQILIGQQQKLLQKQQQKIQRLETKLNEFIQHK